jgi:hypothetical protein
MHDARLNKAESTVIIFMNEEDTLLRLILATLSQGVEFAQTSTPRSLTQMSNILVRKQHRAWAAAQKRLYNRAFGFFSLSMSRMSPGTSSIFSHSTSVFFHREGIEDAVPSWMEWGNSP